MPRISRKAICADFVHVMVQGINKEYIFDRDEEKRVYLKYLFSFKNDYDIEIVAHCIMDNHAHLLLHVSKIANLGEFMKTCNEKFVRYFNKKYDRVGVLFRNRYQSEEVYDDFYLKNCINYIHNNPVKAKMVARADEYPYSSYLSYSKKINPGIKLIKEKYGNAFDFDELIDSSPSRVFIDTEEDRASYSVDNLVTQAIKEFTKENGLNLIDIFSNKIVLKDLFLFLTSNCNLLKSDILNYFEINNYYFQKNFIK